MYRCSGDDQHAGQRIAWRYATAADVEAYYGSARPQTIRAMVVTRNEEPFFIVGLASDHGFKKAFSEYKPGCKPLLKSMSALRAIKTVSGWIEESLLPVVAVAQPNEPESPALLRRLGFAFHSASDRGDVYEWLG